MAKFTKTVTRKTATPAAPKFWLYTQNSSRGYFEKELPYYLFVEALTYDHANMIAKNLGVYFDYTYQWSECDSYDDGVDVPTIYGESIEDFLSNSRYTSHHYMVAVVRLNGETTHYRAED